MTAISKNEEINQHACEVELKKVREIEASNEKTDTNERLFFITLSTDEFKPRAKRDEILHMQRNIDAQDGDIVAIGDDNTLNRQVAWYVDGLKYYAVCGAISYKYR